MNRKITKAELKQLQKLHKFRCKCKYYSILFAYFYDFMNKFYLVSLPLLIQYDIVPTWLIKYATPIAITGVIVDFTAKWFMLKNMKFRKNDIYKRKK